MQTMGIFRGAGHYQPQRSLVESMSPSKEAADAAPVHEKLSSMQSMAEVGTVSGSIPNEGNGISPSEKVAGPGSSERKSADGIMSQPVGVERVTPSSVPKWESPTVTHTMDDASTPLMKGKYRLEDDFAIWEGDWGMGSAAFAEGGQKSRFYYRAKRPLSGNKFPFSGLHDGYFCMKMANSSSMKVAENNLSLMFIEIPHQPGVYKVGGHGSNRIGSFDLDGTFNSGSGLLEVKKLYRPAARAGRKPSRKVTPKRPRRTSLPAASPPVRTPTPVSRPHGGKGAQGGKGAYAGDEEDVFVTPKARLSAAGVSRSRSERKRVVPSYLRETSDEFDSGEGLKLMAEIMDNLMGHQYAHPFLQPVDPEALGIPDYFDIIAEPMDLGTIKKKVDSDEYTSIDEVAADVRLTFANAKKYNRPQHIIHQWAKVLDGIFDKKFKELRNKLGLPSAGRARSTPKPKPDVDEWSPAPSSASRRTPGHRSVGRPSRKRQRSYVQHSEVDDEDEEDSVVDGGVSEIERMKNQIEQMKKQIEQMNAAAAKAMPQVKPEPPKTVVSSIPPMPEKPVKPMNESVPLTFEEKRQLSININKLPGDKLTRVLQIISERMPISKTQENEQEIEIDIGSLDTQTLRHLQRYVNSCLNSKRKKPKIAPVEEPRQEAVQAQKEQMQQVKAELEVLQKNVANKAAVSNGDSSLGNRRTDLSSVSKMSSVPASHAMGGHESESSFSSSDESDSLSSGSDSGDDSDASDDEDFKMASESVSATSKTLQRSSNHESHAPSVSASSPEEVGNASCSSISAMPSEGVVDDFGNSLDRPQVKPSGHLQTDDGGKLEKSEKIEVENKSAWSSIAVNKGDAETGATPKGQTASLWKAVQTEEQKRKEREWELARQAKIAEQLRRSEAKKQLENISKEKEALDRSKEEAEKRERLRLEEMRRAKEEMRAEERARREKQAQSVNLDEQQLTMLKMEQEFGTSSFGKSAMSSEIDFD